HYTTSGVDAVTVADTLAWVDEGAARMVAAFVVEDGWPAPPADEGRGGDDRLDVYLRALDANGYAHEEPTAAGGGTGYIEVDPANATLGRAAFESIVGHEVHPILQLAAAGGFVDAWIAEADATYAQYLLFDDESLTLARNFLWRVRLSQPERSLDDAGHG